MPFPPNFTNVWDDTFPPDTQLANLLGQDLRQLRLDITERMSLISGTFANRPAPETLNATWGGAGFGLLYFSIDTGQVFQWTGGGGWVDVSGAIGGKYKFEGSNIIPVTIANTVALTSLQSVNIPANDIGIGQTFNLKGSGVMGGLTGSSLQVYLYLDNVEIDGGNPLNIALNTANNQLWGIEVFFTGLTTGVAGTIQRPNMLWLGSPSDGGTLNNSSGVGAGFIIDTTAPHLLQLKVLWSAAFPANTITQQTMSVTRTG